MGKALDGMSVRVAVLGAGLSGICMAIQLRKQGIHDFVMFEKADSVGGTWRENTYPGIACDVPSHVYSYSFELNPDWSHAYSSGREIWDYCRHCVEKYKLEEHLKLSCEVRSVKFEEDCWQITTADGVVTADVVVSGLGGLHLPNRIDIKGMECFEGARFHTAEWDHNHSIGGKRVAIIGTGASSAQVLPGIADDVESVTVFQRSAAWVLPRMAQDIPQERRDLFRRSPWRMRLHRWYVWMLMDFLGVLSLKRDGPLAGRLKLAGLQHLENSVNDPEIRERLTPDYEPGCKRRVISDDYLSTFNEDHVYLVTEDIDYIEKNGIRDVTGKFHEVDTIVEATGFRPFDISSYVRIEGRNGKALKDAWSERVETFRTMMVPSFPNFFLLLGPNSATGHTSALIMIESQVRYAIQCLQLMDRTGISQLDPDPHIVIQYNRRLQKALGKMVFGGGCNAWYTDENDVNFTLWPYSATRFLWEQWHPKISEFRSPLQASN